MLIIEKKNNELVNIIKSGLSDLKDEIENMSEDEKELNNQIEWCILLKRFLILIIKIKKDKD